MHILEERKKSLAYDLKLSGSQTGICLQMRENQEILWVKAPISGHPREAEKCLQLELATYENM